MTGVDGGHFGYLIHAPELARSDYRCSGLEPIVGNGAYLCGERHIGRLRAAWRWRSMQRHARAGASLIFRRPFVGRGGVSRTPAVRARLTGPTRSLLKARRA